MDSHDLTAKEIKRQEVAMFWKLNFPKVLMQSYKDAVTVLYLGAIWVSYEPVGGVTAAYSSFL